MKKRVVILGMAIVLVLTLFYTRQNFTGLVVNPAINQESRYQQLKACISNGGEVNACRLQLGVLSKEIYESTPNPEELPPGDIPANSINVKDLGAYGDGQSHLITAEDLNNHAGWNGKYHPGDEWDTVIIQEAIDTNPEHKLIFIPQGTYLIYRQGEKKGKTLNVGLKFVSGTHLQGTGSPYPILKNRDADDAVIFDHEYITLQDIRLDSLKFEGITISFAAGSLGQMNNIFLRNCAFHNGVKPRSSDDLSRSLSDPEYLPNNRVLEFSRVKTGGVDNCVFTFDATHHGRGILIWRSHDITVENSVFSGALQTAINVIGALSADDKNIEADWPLEHRSHGIVLKNNLIQRNLPPKVSEDHGIYAWGTDGLEIYNNYISGWSQTTAGGSIKIRNGKTIKIRCNEMYGSGVVAYNYVKGALNRIATNSPDGFGEPPYLRDVLVENNLVVLEDAKDCTSSGVNFWRDAGEHDRADFESQIVINRNTFINGCIEMNNPLQGSAFSLTNNKLKRLIIGSYVGEYSKTNNQVCEDCVFERTLPQECGSVPHP